MFYRRHLPHWHPHESWLFVTWRLAGSMPRDYLTERIREAQSPGQAAYVNHSGRAFVDFDRMLDRAVCGPCWLKNAGIATMVCEVIQTAEERHFCTLGAYAVMPNHVHLLALPRVSLAKITGWIKGVSARQANLMLGRTGSFWQHESFDHWVRDSREFERIANYIRYNPVRAGLSKEPGDWPWSSASRGFSLSSDI
ncbi:MAG: transposase [Bryobacterales bacterium]|nr:transposase [Bryobacterales bacterium]MBV9400198.1 transposase [Bryobacterales bacterium]